MSVCVCVCVRLCACMCVYVCVCVYACVCTMLVSSAGWGMCGSGHTCTQYSYGFHVNVICYCRIGSAALLAEIPTLCALLKGHGGAAERTDSGAACKTKRASLPKQDSVVQAQLVSIMPDRP